jgi:glycerol kinase
MAELILGLDVGSTSTRALVIDLSGRIHGQALARLESTHPAAGRVEQDPRIVWQQVESTIAEALAIGGHKATDLAAVGVAAQRSSVVVWDRASGEALGPMILWSDLRGTDRAAELAAAGHLAPAIAAVSKLEAAIDGIENGRARVANRELAWGTLDSFLVHRLTGGELHLTDYSNAWSTCYLDLSTLRGWNQSLIDFQDLSNVIFPTLCDTYGPLGMTATSSFGAEIPLGAIVADQQSGMFAHGAFSAGDWKATFGTSATMMVSTGNTPTLAAGLMPMLLAGRGDETLFAVEGMVISAGGLLDWLVRDLGLYASMDELTNAAASVAGSEGVAIRPALQGLGAPYNDSTHRGAVVGLSGASTPREIARAAFESLAFRMREITNAAEAIDGIEVPEILPVDGGLAANDVFLQIQADLLGRPVARHENLEATALGACIAAALGTGLATQSDVAPLTRTGKRFDPTIDASESEERFEAWRQAIGVAGNEV